MEEVKKLNFLEEIIEDDLKSGKVSGVLTRFPPEPNGYLHLGHAKSLCINFGLAQKYGGKTNPIGRLMLHNHRLSIVHPVTRELMHFEVPVPAAFRKVVQSNTVES